MQGTFAKTDHIPCHKTNFNKFKRKRNNTKYAFVLQ